MKRFVQIVTVYKIWTHVEYQGTDYFRLCFAIRPSDALQTSSARRINDARRRYTPTRSFCTLWVEPTWRQADSFFPRGSQNRRNKRRPNVFYHNDPRLPTAAFARVGTIAFICKTHQYLYLSRDGFEKEPENVEKASRDSTADRWNKFLVVKNEYSYENDNSSKCLSRLYGDLEISYESKKNNFHRYQQIVSMRLMFKSRHWWKHIFRFQRLMSLLILLKNIPRYILHCTEAYTSGKVTSLTTVFPRENRANIVRHTAIGTQNITVPVGSCPRR